MLFSLPTGYLSPLGTAAVIRAITFVLVLGVAKTNSVGGQLTGAHTAASANAEFHQQRHSHQLGKRQNDDIPHLSLRLNDLALGQALSPATLSSIFLQNKLGGNYDPPNGHHLNHHQHKQQQPQQNHDADYYFPESQSNTQPQSHQPDPLLPRNKPRLPDKEYLSHHLANKACKLDRGCQRMDIFNNTYLSYCSRYKLENLLSNEILMSIMHDSSEECDKILDEFIQLDELINQFDRLFKNLLTRYNCHNGYSVKWSCEDCKRAYKDWLCSTNLPYYMNGERIKPCISFCERVEQRCPYFHPITKEQYGGQPVFICRDPNIPFVPEITPDIPYSEPSKCYELCHLSDNLTELITDSLSKYEYDKCPDKVSLAEEVRSSDPLYCNLDLQFQQSNRSKTLQQGQNVPSPVTEYSSEESIFNINGTMSSEERPLKSTSNRKTNISQHVHTKKLNELREVLTIYKSQPKTHGFGHHSEHSFDGASESLSHHSIWSSQSHDEQQQ